MDRPVTATAPADAKSASVLPKPSSLTRKGGATRGALLDSTLTLIASRGYAATTTQAVLDHSGLSRGSLLHQFKTREVLMLAAADEALARMANDAQVSLAKFDDQIEALRGYPGVLWELQNQVPARAFAELQLASRWEKGLQAGLRRLVRETNDRIGRDLRRAAEAHGLANVDRLIAEIGALISAMQGLAVSSSLIEDEQTVREVLDVLSAHYSDCLEEAIAAS